MLKRARLWVVPECATCDLPVCHDEARTKCAHCGRYIHTGPGYGCTFDHTDIDSFDTTELCISCSFALYIDSVVARSATSHALDVDAVHAISQAVEGKR